MMAVKYEARAASVEPARRSPAAEPERRALSADSEPRTLAARKAYPEAEDGPLDLSTHARKEIAVRDFARHPFADPADYVRAQVILRQSREYLAAGRDSGTESDDSAERLSPGGALPGKAYKKSLMKRYSKRTIPAACSPSPTVRRLLAMIPISKSPSPKRSVVPQYANKGSFLSSLAYTQHLDVDPHIITKTTKLTQADGAAYISETALAIAASHYEWGSTTRRGNRYPAVGIFACATQNRVQHATLPPVVVSVAFQLQSTMLTKPAAAQHFATSLSYSIFELAMSKRSSDDAADAPAGVLSVIYTLSVISMRWGPNCAFAGAFLAGLQPARKAARFHNGGRTHGRPAELHARPPHSCAKTSFWSAPDQTLRKQCKLVRSTGPRLGVLCFLSKLCETYSLCFG
ncbi:unnamed protein product, partial [Iphiclides podalirius]